MRQLSPPTHPTHPIVTVTCCHNDLGYLATLKAGNAESLRDFHHLSYFSYMFINHCRPPQEKQLLSHSQVRYGGITWRTLWCSEEKKHPLASSQFMAQDQHIMAYYPGSIQWPRDTRYLGQGAWRTGCGPQSFSCSPRCIASCFSGVPCWHSQPASAKTSLEGSPGFIANKWDGATTSTITPIGEILNPLLIYHWGSPKREVSPWFPMRPCLFLYHYDFCVQTFRSTFLWLLGWLNHLETLRGDGVEVISIRSCCVFLVAFAAGSLLWVCSWKQLP